LIKGQIHNREVINNLIHNSVVYVREINVQVNNVYVLRVRIDVDMDVDVIIVYV